MIVIKRMVSIDVAAVEVHIAAKRLLKYCCAIAIVKKFRKGRLLYSIFLHTIKVSTVILDKKQNLCHLNKTMITSQLPNWFS